MKVAKFQSKTAHTRSCLVSKFAPITFVYTLVVFFATTVDSAVCVCSFVDHSRRFHLVAPSPFCAVRELLSYSGPSHRLFTISACRTQTLVLRGGGDDSTAAAGKDKAASGSPRDNSTSMHPNDAVIKDGMRTSDTNRSEPAALLPVTLAAESVPSAAAAAAADEVSWPRRIVWQRPSQSGRERVSSGCGSVRPQRLPRSPPASAARTDARPTHSFTHTTENTPAPTKVRE